MPIIAYTEEELIEACDKAVAEATERARAEIKRGLDVIDDLYRQIAYWRDMARPSPIVIDRGNYLEVLAYVGPEGRWRIENAMRDKQTPVSDASATTQL